MKPITALCLIFLTVVKVLSESQVCKNIVHCQCGYSNNSKFHGNDQTTTNIPDNVNLRILCPEQSNVCSNGTIVCQDPDFTTKEKLEHRDGTLGKVASTRESAVYSCEFSDYTVQGLPLSKCINSGKWSSVYPRYIKIVGKTRSKRQSENSSNGTSTVDEEIMHEVQNNIIECGVSQTEEAMKDPIFMVELKGSEAWPWAVTLSRSTNSTVVDCNAVLLNANTVATSAGCVSNLNTVFLHFGRGSRNVSADDANPNVRVSSKILLHPGYDGNESRFDKEFDIALIQFAPSITYTEKVLPICLPTNESTEKNVVPGNVGYAAGFGFTSFRETRSDKLMFESFPVVPDEDCDFSIGPVAFRPSDTDFCGGTTTAPYLACVGNGAAFAFYDNETGTFTLEGIVRRRLCRHNGRPTNVLIMTKVQSALSWIYEHLSV